MKLSKYNILIVTALFCMFVGTPSMAMLCVVVVCDSWHFPLGLIGSVVFFVVGGVLFIDTVARKNGLW